MCRLQPLERVLAEVRDDLALDKLPVALGGLW
jgi:hypothetical protein